MMSEQKKDKKGFIESLKQKPQTLAEAKQKTKNFFILVGAFAGVFSILCALLHILFGLIVALGSAGFLVFLFGKESQKNKRNFCSECGAKIDYQEGVTWEVTGYNDKEYTPNPNASGKQITSKRIANVHFTCTCLECGNAREFNEKYDVIIWYDDGTAKKNNVETLAKNYFKL